MCYNYTHGRITGRTGGASATEVPLYLNFDPLSVAPDAVTLFFYSFFVFQLPRGHRTRVRGCVRESPLAVATCSRFFVFMVTVFCFLFLCFGGWVGGKFFFFFCFFSPPCPLFPSFLTCTHNGRASGTCTSAVSQWCRVIMLRGNNELLSLIGACCDRGSHAPLHHQDLLLPVLCVGTGGHACIWDVSPRTTAGRKGVKFSRGLNSAGGWGGWGGGGGGLRERRLI